MVVGSGRASKINREVVEPENSGKIMGTSNSKACDIRHLRFLMVVLWLVGLAAGHCIHYQQATCLGVST